MSKGEHTRTEILKTAIGQASQVGLEGLSIGTLARDVGMSKSGLFAHFGSKEELQRAVIEAAAHLFGEAVMRPAFRAPRGEPRVRALFDNWLAWTQSSATAGCLFVSSATEFDDRPGPVRDAVVDAVRDWRNALARAARLAVEAGHFRSDVDPEQFAFHMHALMLGYHMEARLFRNEEAGQRARASFEALLASSR